MRAVAKGISEAKPDKSPVEQKLGDWTICRGQLLVQHAQPAYTLVTPRRP
jgi:hypothetical protein